MVEAAAVEDRPLLHLLDWVAVEVLLMVHYLRESEEVLKSFDGASPTGSSGRGSPHQLVHQPQESVSPGDPEEQHLVREGS